MRFTQGKPSAGWNYQQDFGNTSGLTFGRIARHLIGAGFGALVGAGAMYLLDPELGYERRQHLADATNDTLDHATETIRDTAHYARDRVAHAGSALLEHGSSLAESASDSLHAGKKYLPKLSRMTRGQHHMSAGSASVYALSGVGLLAAGAGAMWLFDARLGRGRRAWIRQKVSRAAHETGRFMRSTGRHLRNKARGYTHRASGMARHQADSLASDCGCGAESESEPVIQIEAISFARE